MFWKDLKRWFSYYKVCRKIYDFDYTSILTVERHQMERVRDCIYHWHNYMNYERDVNRINLALQILNIIEEDGCSKRIGKDLDFKEKENGLYEVIDDPEAKWILPVYVNTKNYKRFWKELDPNKFQDPKIGNLFKDDLRLTKAWHLYHKIKCYNLKNWWT